MGQGDIVLVRSSRGQPGVRRIWDDGPERPFVCHEEYWARWERQGLAPVCSQVGRDQIFDYDAALAAQLEEAFWASRNSDLAATKRLNQMWEQARPRRV
ncbi:MAG: hypothetical protein V3V35_05485 [Dehalococcoidia bacterium]